MKNLHILPSFTFQRWSSTPITSSYTYYGALSSELSNLTASYYINTTNTPHAVKIILRNLQPASHDDAQVYCYLDLDYISAYPLSRNNLSLHSWRYRVRKKFGEKVAPFKIGWEEKRTYANVELLGNCIQHYRLRTLASLRPWIPLFFRAISFVTCIFQLWRVWDMMSSGFLLCVQQYVSA